MSNTEIQVYANPRFDDAKIALIKRVIAPTVSNDEFAMFIERCRQTGLDPIARQIYAISRYDRQAGGNRMTIQVSIDGMRLLAERSGKYAGQIGPFLCGEDGEWKDVWLSSKPPIAAKVGVCRSDFREPLWAVAKYSSYVQTNKEGAAAGLWAKMPEVMLSKCAESLAIRRAFPHETSGLYTREEMMQADQHGVTVDGVVSSTRLNELFLKGKEKKLFSKPEDLADLATEVLERQIDVTQLYSMSDDEALRVELAISADRGLNGAA